MTLEPWPRYDGITATHPRGWVCKVCDWWGGPAKLKASGRGWEPLTAQHTYGEQYQWLRTG